MRHSSRIAVVAVLTLVTAGCGDLERGNPADPAVNGGLALRDRLLGSWSRADEAQNEIFTFRDDGGVELRRFSSPGGGSVDRNAPFPTTVVQVFEGTYALVGNVLTIFFTRADSTDPDDIVQPPSSERGAEIGISKNTLTLTESDGKRFYTSL